MCLSCTIISLKFKYIMVIDNSVLKISFEINKFKTYPTTKNISYTVNNRITSHHVVTNSKQNSKQNLLIEIEF